MRWELPRLPFVELLSCCVLFKKEDVKRASFNPDQFLQRRTIFSSENIGPADQNFQDQYSRDSTPEHVHFLRWKYCRGTMSTIAPPSNFNDSTYEILTPRQLQAHTQTKVNLGTASEARTSIMVPENSTYKHSPKWSMEAGTSYHNSGLWSLSTLFMNG